MSIGESGTPEYKRMITALGKEKMRIVFDTKQGKFEYLTTDEAKAREMNPEDYVTKLPLLRLKVEGFIKEKGIDYDLKKQLENAFEAKANELNERFILWGDTAQRDKAVSELKKFPEAIDQADKAHTVAKAAIPTNIPPSSEGPALKKSYVLEPLPSKARNLDTIPQPPPTDLPPQYIPPQEQPSEKPMRKGEPSPPPGGAKGPGVPLPPPPGGAVQKSKFTGEPEEPKIDRTNLKGKNAEVLSQEAQTIREYVTATQKALEPIETLVQEHTKLKEELSATTKDHYIPARAQFEGLKRNMGSLVDLWNSKKSGKLPIGEGTMKLYTDAEYNAEMIYRSTIDPSLRKIYNEKVPIGEANKLSFATLVSYSAIKNQQRQVGKKGEKTFTLVDTEGKEIIPVTSEKKGTKTDLRPQEIPPDQKDKFVSFEEAKGPLTLREDVIKEGEEGVLTVELNKAKERMEKIEKSKSGNIAFKDFETKVKTKKNDLSKWQAAATNREKASVSGVIAQEEVVLPATSLWEEIQEQRHDIKEQAIEWEQVDSKLRTNIQINPAGVLLGALTTGEVL